MGIINQLKIEKNYLMEIFSFWLKLRKYNASNHTISDIEKMQYTILRLNHTLEKGMSMRNPRKGFGQQKAIRLIQLLNRYCDLYLSENEKFLKYPISTISSYIKYTVATGVEIPNIQDDFKHLVDRVGLDGNNCLSGITFVTKDEIIKEASGNFESLLRSRHSIRFFESDIPQKEKIEKALSLAQKTPSACNRQGWKTHVFMGDKSIELLKWQRGCLGFENEIKCSILVTANLKAFFDYEVHQAYIDGGLYAMNLINAINSLGLGTIPLSVGFSHKKLRDLNKKFGIPENEVPIVIVGVGELQNRFKVAVSERKEIEITNTYH